MLNTSIASSRISSETRTSLLAQLDGVLLIDKPAGPTSHDVVAMVRRAMKTRRVGHVGTLDPFATGLLIVLLGRSTRLARFLVGLPKEYLGTIRLGLSTTTDDLLGEPLVSSEAWQTLSDSDIGEAMTALVGRTAQRPPRFSAKSVDGHRAYRRARRGEDFELEARLVDVDRFELLAREGRDLQIRTAVGSGVYIRSLARDLGERLGCGAHLASLRRTSIGRFDLAEAIPLDAVVTGAATLKPPIVAVAHLKSIQIGDSERDFVRKGRAIPATAEEPGTIALLSGGELVAVAESDGIVFRPSVVLEG